MADPGAIIVCPTPHGGVQLADEGCLRPILALTNHPSQLREMGFDIGLGWSDQGFVPETLRASGAFPGLVFPDSVLTNREAQDIHARLIAFQGVADARFACVQRQSDASPPLAEALLTLLQDCTLRMEHQAVIGISNDPSFRIHVGNGETFSTQDLCPACPAGAAEAMRSRNGPGGARCSAALAGPGQAPQDGIG